MKNKIKNNTKVNLLNLPLKSFGRRFFTTGQRAIAIISVITLVLAMSYFPAPSANAAGIDNVTVTLSDETLNTASSVTVAFTFGTLINGNTVKIYLGEDTTGQPWQLNAVTTADISCSDNGTGETYTVNSVTAASASVPMWTQITATTVGAGATAVTCIIGDGTPNPINPATTADGYSIAVVTTNDSGAGIAYVGNANDVTVSVTVLPNLSLTIDNSDGVKCSTSGAGVTSCNMGTVLTTGVATGNYDVNVGTNAGSGATLQVAEDGNLRNGSDVITDVVEGNTVTAGTTGYGVATVADGGWTEQGDFTDDDTPIATGPTTVATTAAPVAYTNDITVTHRAAVDSTVKALTYSHTVTWTATANF